MGEAKRKAFEQIKRKQDYKKLPEKALKFFLNFLAMPFVLLVLIPLKVAQDNDFVWRLK